VTASSSQLGVGDGVSDGFGDSLGDGEVLGELDGDSEADGDADALGETDSLGEGETLADVDGSGDAGGVVSVAEAVPAPTVTESAIAANPLANAAAVRTRRGRPERGACMQEAPLRSGVPASVAAADSDNASAYG
jgi:hypothetical protein